MLFVTLLKIRQGKLKEARKFLQSGENPEGISIKAYLGLFGRYDALLIFEAPDSGRAASFVTDMMSAFETETFATISPAEI